MTDRDTTYAVVGGGIVGASVAYHLSERTDEPVTVFEAGDVGGETTAKSMAMYGLYGDETQYRMKRYGLRLYNEFFEDPRGKPAYDLAGRLEVATTPDGARELETGVTGDAGGKSLSGIDRDMLEYVPGDALKEVLLLPHLDTDPVEGAAFRPRVGFVEPRALATEFADRARENGVRFETGVRVTDVLTAEDEGTERVVGLATDAGDVDADAVVCAAGPWNVAVARMAGVSLPVRHTLAPIIKLRSTEPAVYSLPAISHHESPYAIYRQRSRDTAATFVGYNPSEQVGDLDDFFEAYAELDPDAVSDEIPDDIREGMWETVDRFVPSLSDADVLDEWVGVRSMTPDGNPVVGWTDVEGFSVAAFHTSGIQLAPKVGDVIARQLVDDEPTDLYDALSVSRFDGFTDVHAGDAS